MDTAQDDTRERARIYNARVRANFPAMKKRLLQSLVLVLVVFNVAVGLRVYQAVGAQEKDDSGYRVIGHLSLIDDLYALNQGPE